MKKHLQENWKFFERHVIPASASEEQRHDMRDCYYSGAYVLFKVLTAGVSDAPEETPEDMALMKGLSDELDAWKAEKLILGQTRERGQG